MACSKSVRAPMQVSAPPPLCPVACGQQSRCVSQGGPSRRREAAWPELCVGPGLTDAPLQGKENWYSYEASAVGQSRADRARSQLAEPAGQPQVARFRQRGPQPDADFAQGDDAARPARA